VSSREWRGRIRKEKKSGKLLPAFFKVIISLNRQNARARLRGTKHRMHVIPEIITWTGIRGNKCLHTEIAIPLSRAFEDRGCNGHYGDSSECYYEECYGRNKRRLSGRERNVHRVRKRRARSYTSTQIDKMQPPLPCYVAWIALIPTFQPWNQIFLCGPVWVYRLLFLFCKLLDFYETWSAG